MVILGGVICFTPEGRKRESDKYADFLPLASCWRPALLPYAIVSPEYTPRHFPLSASLHPRKMDAKFCVRFLCGSGLRCTSPAGKEVYNIAIDSGEEDEMRSVLFPSLGVVAMLGTQRPGKKSAAFVCNRCVDVLVHSLMSPAS